MEGYSSENSSSDKKDDKSEKKAGKAAGLGSRTFEFANKKDAAEKIAESSSIWEKLIPKDGGEKAKEAAPTEKAVDTKPDIADTEPPKPEAAEEAPDSTIETLTPGEKAEVVKEYAQEKTAELEAGRTDTEDPAEAAAREANIEFLKTVEDDAEATPLEPVEDAPETFSVPEEQVTDLQEGPAELAHDESIELNAAEAVLSTVEATEDTITKLVAPAAPASFRAAPSTPNFASAPSNFSPERVPATAENHYQQSNEGAYFLAGGILGYMLGRRRGRIKTERRMKAVSKKLEKQISETRQQIARQETTIREQARVQYNRAHSAETTVVRTEYTARPESATGLTRTEARPSGIERQANAERVQRMDHSEVLALAEKISIDGTSLRTIYEAKQITEPGLRRITNEYLNGGDIKAALKQELQVKEMQYERDPQMRDRLAASYAGVDAAQPQASREALASLLAQNESPKSTQHPHYDQTEQEEAAAKNHGHQVLISAWAAFVVVLVIVAVVLAMR